MTDKEREYMSLSWNAIRAKLQRACEDAGGQRAFARKIGTSATYVNQTLNGVIPPGGRILAALGLERVVVVRRKK